MPTVTYCGIEVTLINETSDWNKVECDYVSIWLKENEFVENWQVR